MFCLVVLVELKFFVNTVDLIWDKSKLLVRVAGRGRGEGGFYQRSIEESEVGFGRSVREIHRSQSWDDR